MLFTQLDLQLNSLSDIKYNCGTVLIKSPLEWTAPRALDWTTAARIHLKVTCCVWASSVAGVVVSTSGWRYLLAPLLDGLGTPALLQGQPDAADWLETQQTGRKIGRSEGNDACVTSQQASREAAGTSSRRIPKNLSRFMSRRGGFL